ncbi:MAG: phytoene desaturase family protein [Pseudomonadota bacterium]
MGADGAYGNPPSRPHAVVIGSGFGGLAAAVRLGARGMRVTVLERLDSPGGRARVFRQDGFSFDAGPTIITAPYLLEELWSLCGRKLSDDLTLRSLDPFYRIRFDDGSSFLYSADLDLLRREVAKFEPADVPALDAFLAESERIFDVAFTELVDQPFNKFSTMVRAVPDMLRLGGFRSVYGKVAQFFRNEKLRTVFSFHPLLIGGNPFSTTAYFCLISHLERAHGVHYAVGGTNQLVSGLVGLIEGHGNTVRCEAEVSRITVDDGRATGVTLASGEKITADIVVSNADAAYTYDNLLGREPRRRWSRRRLASAAYSMGLFVWYFGTDRTYEEVDHHTIVLGPRYRELLQDIFQRKHLAEDFSLYLHRPTASDPSLAPPGCDAFYVLSPVPHLGSGTDWAEQGEQYRQAIAQRLESTLLPDLTSHLVSSKVMTPQQFNDDLLSRNGAAFSLQPQLFQSAWFRPHNMSEEISGLYLVGAGTHPGAGVPGVIASAKVLEKVLDAAPPPALAARPGMFGHRATSTSTA